LRDSYAVTIMQLPRCRIPILTVAGLIEIAALHRGGDRTMEQKSASAGATTRAQYAALQLGLR